MGLFDSVISMVLEMTELSPFTSVLPENIIPKYIPWDRSDLLQSGLNQHLALTTIKGKISALSILFQSPLTSHSPVKAAVQGVTDTVPPVHLPMILWDINMVHSTF